MSADNQIVVIRLLKDCSDPWDLYAVRNYTYRVAEFGGKFEQEIHYYQHAEPYNLGHFIWCVFKGSPEFTAREEAYKYADKLYEEIGWVENGITYVQYDLKFPE